MADKEVKYYSFQDILKFLSFDYEFEKKNNKIYPFHRGKENVYFSWGQIIIPKYGIWEMVNNKISDIDKAPISEINMVYNIPFHEISSGDIKCGVISKNISLSFRYDKQYKYGDINKSIYEVCFWILEHAKKMNDFYIITDDMIQEFMSYYVINNQCGLGCLEVCSPCVEKMN